MSIDPKLSFSLLALENVDNLDYLFSLLKKKNSIYRATYNKIFSNYKFEKKINFLKN